MKRTSEVFSFAVILFIVLKIVDFRAPSGMDIAIIALFAIYAVIELMQIILGIRRERHAKAKEKDRI